MVEIKVTEIPEEVRSLAMIILSPYYDGWVQGSARKKLERTRKYIEKVLEDSSEELEHRANLGSVCGACNSSDG